MRFKTASLCLFFLLCLGGANLFAQPVDPASAQAENSMQRALDHYSAGKLNEAAGLLRGFVISHADSGLVDQAYYYLARIHHDLDG